MENIKQSDTPEEISATQKSGAIMIMGVLLLFIVIVWGGSQLISASQQAFIYNKPAHGYQLYSLKSSSFYEDAKEEPTIKKKIEEFKADGVISEWEYKELQELFNEYDEQRYEKSNIEENKEFTRTL